MTFKHQWTTAPEQPALCDVLSRELGISPLLAQCLLNRGLSEPDPIQCFLEPRLKHLSDPFLIPGMKAAVDRLSQAREQNEPVLLFGDYDADGVSATALLKEALETLGWQVHYYLPNRFNEGYGLSRAAVENALSRYSAKVLLAIDCGSTSVDTVAWLSDSGMDVVILDHHQIADPAPQAVAMVNPQAASKEDPDFRELCSAGLAFKLAHALVKQGRNENRLPELEYDVRPLLDLVALGTVADLVPLTGENRILVTAGIDRLNRTHRPGLKALRDVAGVQHPIRGYEIGFQLAPRLNAAGRLNDAMEALELILAPTTETATPIAERLDHQNRERQETQSQIVDAVLESVQAQFDPEEDYVIVEGHESWHLGVVGIVASRVLTDFYRPTIILGGGEGEWRGSGRSIEGFDLAAALGQCDDLLIKHGGHAMAAGLSIDPGRIDAFRQRINEIARASLNPSQLNPSIRLDACVPLEEMTLTRLNELARLQHTGIGNPSVKLWCTGLKHQRPLKRIGREKQHVKLWVTDGQIVCEAVWWRGGEKALPVGRFDLAFTPEINSFQGRTSVQLKVLDWRPSG